METIELNSSYEIRIGDVITKWGILYIITGYLKFDDGTKMLTVHQLYKSVWNGISMGVAYFREIDVIRSCFLKVVI